MGLPLHWDTRSIASTLNLCQKADQGTFGVRLAKIAAEFKLDIEDRLAAILLARVDTDLDDDGPPRRARLK